MSSRKMMLDAATDPSALVVVAEKANAFALSVAVYATANISGGHVNSAIMFRMAVGSFKNHVVYWIGPLIGAALAGILYDNVVFPVQVPGIVNGVGV
ncbi:hypothetical protein ACSBR2_022307 [Camellia fascicularis]